MAASARCNAATRTKRASRLLDYLVLGNQTDTRRIAVCELDAASLQRLANLGQGALIGALVASFEAADRLYVDTGSSGKLLLGDVQQSSRSSAMSWDEFEFFLLDIRHTTDESPVYPSSFGSKNEKARIVVKTMRAVFLSSR